MRLKPVSIPGTSSGSSSGPSAARSSASEPVLVASRENARFRLALELVQSSRERRKREQTFIEGVHLCKAYLDRHPTPRQAFATEEALRHQEVAAIWKGLSCERIVLAPALYRDLTQVEHGIALAFVIDTPRSQLPQSVESTLVYLDRVQDPGNVGTILRSCAAAGIAHLVTSPGSAFCWAPKVLRAAMGAHFLVDVHEGIEWAALRARLAIPAVATIAGAPKPIWSHDLRLPCVWLFGNEGAGLAPDIASTVDHWLSIPTDARVESLNVGSAVAIALFEQRRQQAQA